MINLTPLELILGVIAIVTAAIVLTRALLTRNSAALNQVTQELNSNVELKDHIEDLILGTVPKETAEKYADFAVKVLNLLTNTVLKLPDEDSKAALANIKAFVSAVTDGKANVEVLPNGYTVVSGISAEEFQKAVELYKASKGDSVG